MKDGKKAMSYEQQITYSDRILAPLTLHSAAQLSLEIHSTFGDDPPARILQSELEQKMAARLFTSMNVAGVEPHAMTGPEGVLLKLAIAHPGVMNAGAMIESRKLEPDMYAATPEVAVGIKACDNTRDCIGVLKQSGLWNGQAASLPPEIDQAMISFFRAQARATAHVAMHKAVVTAIFEDMADTQFFQEALEKARIREEATFELLMEAYRDGRAEPVSPEEWEDKLAVEEVIRQKAPRRNRPE